MAHPVEVTTHPRDEDGVPTPTGTGEALVPIILVAEPQEEDRPDVRSRIRTGTGKDQGQGQGQRKAVGAAAYLLRGTTLVEEAEVGAASTSMAAAREVVVVDTIQ